MANFKTKQVKTQTLGETLVAARNHLGISLVEISKLSKIPTKYLGALEAAIIPSFLPMFMSKGF